MTLEDNVKAFGLTYFGLNDKRHHLAPLPPSPHHTAVLTLRVGG